MMVIALAAAAMRVVSRAEVLPQLRDETALLILRGRALSIHTGQPQVIWLAADRLSLEASSSAEPDFPTQLTFPTGIRVEYQIWPDDRWIRPESPVSLMIQSNGICPPLTLRYTQGAAWISFRIHPLTGAVDAESSHLPRAP